jgi:uncharacterized protein YycO
MKSKFESPNKFESTIDLSLDRNNNQISDAVENIVENLQALPETLQREEIENFVAKLPIIPETLALQARAQELSDSLSTAKTPEEAELVFDELAKISSQLQEDPVIAKVESDLIRLTGYGSTVADPSLSAVDYTSLRRGDILARKSTNKWFPWCMKYEHTGNFDGNDMVYESNLSDGVNLRALYEWKKPGQYVGHARNKRVSLSTLAEAVDWAKNFYGSDGRTPYNWFLFANKWMNYALYCSQLTWKINLHTGYDLDSNHWEYLLNMALRYGNWVLTIVIPAVAPDEVMLSSHVTIKGEGPR